MPPRAPTAQLPLGSSAGVNNSYKGGMRWGTARVEEHTPSPRAFTFLVGEAPGVDVRRLARGHLHTHSDGNRGKLEPHRNADPDGQLRSGGKERT